MRYYFFETTQLINVEIPQDDIKWFNFVYKYYWIDIETKKINSKSNLQILFFDDNFIESVCLYFIRVIIPHYYS